MNWPGPILTDSGGFQVWSLAELRKLTEEGVRFRSPVNGDPVLLTPESSIAVQTALDADIVMVFDECTPYPASEAVARNSMELSARWAARSRVEFDRLGNANALFGIVQGGTWPRAPRRFAGRADRASASTATRSAGSRSASRPRSASPCSRRSTR